MAAVLAFGPDAVLSHRSAGQLWGLVPRSAIRPEVTRPGFVRGRPGIVVHRSAIPGDERTVVDGIPVTTVPRAMLDLAALLSERQLEQAWNEMEVRRLTDRLSVPDLLERHPGRRGAANLSALIASKAPGGVTRNDLEEGFVALVDAHHLPRPRLNAPLWLRGRFYEIDCLWERQRLALELDGRDVHRTDQAFEADRQRDRVLMAEGWRTGRVTWRQLHDEPAAIAADLRAALGALPLDHGSGAVRALSERREPTRPGA